MEQARLGWVFLAILSDLSIFLQTNQGEALHQASGNPKKDMTNSVTKGDGIHRRASKRTRLVRGHLILTVFGETYQKNSLCVVRGSLHVF